MRLLVANPNSTAWLTDAMVELARKAASPYTVVEGWTNREGPPAVDSLYGDYMAGRPLARALGAMAPAPDAVALAGFGNYGTGAVKELLDVPVVSMAEAAMATALPLCHRFAIVTTSARMIPYTEDLVQLAGFAPRCAGVCAVELPPIGPGVDDGAAVVSALVEAIALAVSAGADLVILGGARLSLHADAVRPRAAVPVVEPMACATALAETLVRLGLAQSKAGKYARPPREPKEYE